MDAFHIVNDEGWGGYDSQGKLTNTSEAMVSVSDQVLGVGGGAIGRDEMKESYLRGKKVIFVPAELNHDLAIAKANRQGKPIPTQFDGDAHSLLDWLKQQSPQNCNGLVHGHK